MVPLHGCRVREALPLRHRPNPWARLRHRPGRHGNGLRHQRRGLTIQTRRPARDHHRWARHLHSCGPPPLRGETTQPLQRRRQALVRRTGDEGHASMLTLFSNFPLSLATTPGDTAPLAARLPPGIRAAAPHRKEGWCPRLPDNRLRHQHQHLPGRSYERLQQSKPGPVTDSRLSG